MNGARFRPEFRTAPRSLIVARVDRSRLVGLPGAVHPAVARAQDLGLVDDALPLEHMQLALRRTAERQAAFDALVQAQSQPGNPSFRRWLTPEEIGAEFGPSAADLATLRSFLQAEGFTLNSSGKSGMYVDFTGTAGQVRASFGSAIHAFRTPDGASHVGAATAASIPEALAPAVAGFVSLSDLAPHPLRRASVHPVPAFADGGGHQMEGAQDFYAIYNEIPLLSATPTPINGAGQTVALLEQTDITSADVTVFRTTFGVSPATPSLTVVHGSASVPCSDPGITSTSEEGEAVLDTEWAGAAAPAATLLFMSCASTRTTAGIVLSSEAVIDDNLASTMSLSYGDTETGNASVGSFFSNLWQQAAAQGQTVVVSSGDSGSDTADQNTSIGKNGISVNVLSSTAYNISAGGTDFQDTYNSYIDSGTAYGQSAFWNSSNGSGGLSAKGYVPETTWNNTCASSLLNHLKEGAAAAPQALCEDPAQNGSILGPVGGGGGPSVLNARPSWQNGTVFGIPPTSTYTGRLLPDISLFASNGIYGHAIYYYQSDTNPALNDAGGTSFVAPQLAGVFALIQQKTGSRLGLANVELYSLAGQNLGISTYSGSACNGSGASGSGETSSLPASNCVFYDVQTGNNSVGCTPGTPDCYSDAGQAVGILSISSSAAVPAFSTGQGYDMATGIGSVNLTNLVNSWGASLFPAIAVSAATTAYGTSATALSATITFAGATAPTGAVTFAVDGGSAVVATCIGSSSPVTCTAFYPTSTLAAGAHTITVSLAADSNFNAASQTGTLTVTAAAPTITFTVPDHDVADGPFTVSATSDSAGAFTYTVVSGPATVSGASVTLTGTGIVTLRAMQAAIGNYSADAQTATFIVEAFAGIWLGNGNSSLSVFTTAGAAQSPAAGYSGGGLGAVASPQCMAVDHTGHLWVASTGGGVSVFNNSGTATTGSAGITSGGISSPQALAIDGLGQVWIANGTGRLSVLSNAGVAVSPTSGYAGIGSATPGGLAIDLSGNIWLSNPAGNSITEIIGAAGPVAPLSTAVTNGTLGTRP